MGLSVAILSERERKRFWALVDKDGPVPAQRPELGSCWLWTGSETRNGYGQFWLRGRNVRAHRVALAMQLGRDPGERCALHACDVKLCVRHLFDGTRIDNNRDRDAKGRTAAGDRHYLRLNPGLRAGERNPVARLSNTQVAAIRARCAGSGVTQASVAAEYGVSPSYVSQLVSGRRRIGIDG